MKLLSWVKNPDIKIMISLIVLFIVVRSINFDTHLNFSSDQAMFSSKALEIFREGKLTLIGPPSSLIHDGRQIFQGPLIYYVLMIFLMLGGFDPTVSSYIFMIFCAFMIIPLYYGTKWMIDRKAAFFVVGTYAFLPYFIDYTRFFWNPNFQLAFVPILIFAMGLYNLFKKSYLFFIVSLIIGMLLQFHYGFLPFIALVFVYYFFIRRLSIKLMPLFILGILVGMSPLMIFEVRNNFYNMSTLSIFLQHRDQVFPKLTNPPTQNPHYYLITVFLLVFLTAFFFAKKLSWTVLILIVVALGVWSFTKFLPTPTHGFRMADDWNYLDEAKVHEIIKQENIEEFNVMNLAYDTLAEVQKYLLKKDNIEIDYYNYNTNNYLFIITDRTDFMDDAAYEIKTFKPFVIEKEWTINNRYKLYRVKRVIT